MENRLTNTDNPNPAPNLNYVQRDLDLIWHPCSQMKDYQEIPPIVMERGKGCWLYDINGKAYLDVISSWWCNLLGHCNERIIAAVKEQLDQLEHVIFATCSNKPVIELCDRLVQVVPQGLCKFNFTDNGSSSVEVALKMSFQYQLQTGHPEKQRFMCLSDAYHGETLGALSVGGVDLYSQRYKPLMIDAIRIDAPDCYRCPYGKSRGTCQAECFQAAQRTFDQFADQTCALIVEPIIQMAGGMRIYPPLYLNKLREACDQHNILLIADEIGTGFGRTGKLFACNHAEICPDIMCLSKGLTGGYLPMAVVATTQTIFDAFYADFGTHRAFMHSHTYSGNPLAAAAAGTVLKILTEEPILEQAACSAAYFGNLLRRAFEDCPFVGEIRSVGLIHVIELVANRETKAPLDGSKRYGFQIYKRALEKGVLLRCLGDLVYFNPPLNIQPEELELAVRVSRECVRDVLENGQNDKEPTT